MAQLKYCDKHNQVGFLRKPDESAGFAEIVDFLLGSNLRYALTTNPTIYDSLVKQFWQSATANTTADGSLEINATIDTIRYTISEASIRESLQLEDATGITMLPNEELFEGMGQTGSIDKGRRYKRRNESKGKKVVSSFDFQEEVDIGAEQVNTAEGVSTGSTKLSTGSEQLVLLVIKVTSFLIKAKKLEKLL
ncbi:hypothetical protein Tco_1002211 [Tanacetum coccineum]|uniref:Xylulose kinase-1 n=1 Tax=Tanacetum coccineum TaxID=301880 RepID=A0ABQ5F5P4_9ASTR